MIKYIVMVFAGACSFGILSTFVKLAYREGYSAAELTFSQALISMLFLWVLSVWREKARQAGSPQRIPGKVWLSLLLTGAAIGLTTYVYYLSVIYIPASLAVVILMQFTWMSALLEWLCFKKRPGGAQLAIMIVILCGTVMASGLANVHLTDMPVRGIGYALGSALLYALYVVASSRTVKEVPPLRKSAIIMAGFALGILVFNVGELWAHRHFDIGLIKWILFLSLFGALIPQVLFAKGIPQVGAGISAIIMTAELPVAVIAAHLILGELVDGWQWVGIAVMLLAMALMNRRAK
jgi:drug/metabolite transporter (DMT)-like permease